MKWLIFHLVLKPLILINYAHRERCSCYAALMFGLEAGPDKPYLWDKWYWADELAYKWGFYVEGWTKSHNRLADALFGKMNTGCGLESEHWKKALSNATDELLKKSVENTNASR